MTLGPREALLRMPAMWKVTDPTHSVLASEPRPGEVHFEVRGFPGWLDCGLIGTLEQVVLSRDAVLEKTSCCTVRSTVSSACASLAASRRTGAVRAAL
jgi:hypothetical protein